VPERSRSRLSQARTHGLLAILLLAACCAGCGAGARTVTSTGQGAVPTAPSSSASSATTTSTTTPLPGAGKPGVTIGDKNFTEQFVLGQLYLLALQAQGFTVEVNRNIGPTDVTVQALVSGRLAMYPEYLDIWNGSVAGAHQSFRTVAEAYGAGERYALAHGLQLLDPTSFSDTDAVGVTVGYAAENHLRTIDDLRSVAQTLTFGASPQFQQSPTGLPAIQQAYGFTPAAFKALAVGDQYTALDQGTVQAADVASTDGELASGDYVLLGDPRRVFGWGNVVPVVSVKVLEAEGPAFAETIDRVSALLSTDVMRELNQEVDLAHQDPNAVAAIAKRFLETHGVIAPTAS